MLQGLLRIPGFAEYALVGAASKILAFRTAQSAHVIPTIVPEDHSATSASETIPLEEARTSSNRSTLVHKWAWNPAEGVLLSHIPKDGYAIDS